MDAFKSEKIEALRLKQAQQLLESGLVALPDWAPVLVDDRISGLPVVAVSKSQSATYYFVGWTISGESRISDFSVVGVERNGSVTLMHGFTEKQFQLVREMGSELELLLTSRELEGWLADDEAQ